MVRLKYQDKAGIFSLTQQHTKNTAERQTGFKIIYLVTSIGYIEIYNGPAHCKIRQYLVELHCQLPCHHKLAEEEW
jgi:hypothetical protein